MDKILRCVLFFIVLYGCLVLQSLVETVIRNRIYESTYWKEHCFALTGMAYLLLPPEILNSMCIAETLIDKAIEVRFIGGVYGNQRPTEFLCLLLKLLQIQPEKEILVEYLQAEEFKCVLKFTLQCMADTIIIDTYAL